MHRKVAGSARLGTLVLIPILVFGCARDRISVTPAPGDLAAKNQSKRICVVANPNVAVRDFLDSYRAALERRGYSVSVVQGNPQVSACPLTTRYVAYNNGLAQLELYWEGRPAGGGFHSSAALSGEALGLLVDRLLP